MDRFARRCAPALLAALVVVAPLAGGAVYRWSAVSVAIVAIVMTAVALGRGSIRANPRVDVTCGILIAAAAWTLFQLVPLPVGLVRAVAPAVARLYDDAGRLPGATAPRYIPLTVDVSLSAVEAAKWASYAALYGLILNWPRGGGRQVSFILLAAAALTAVICLVQSAFGVSSILGIYHPPVGVSSWLRGPFVNPGHSGVFCAVLGTLCLGLAPEMPARLRIWVRGLALLLLILALTPALLKTTIAAIAGPLLYLIMRARAAERRFVRGRYLLVGAGALSIAMLFLLRWLPSPEAIRAMPERHLALRRFSRLITWSDTVGLIGDFRWTGTGRGAFGAAFTAYDTVNTEALTWHTENVPLQMIAEWGWLVAPLLMGSLAVITLRAARSARRPKSSAAAAVLIMLAAVNMVDFNLELLGMGLMAAVCLGILTRRETASNRARRGVAVLVTPAIIASLSLVVLAAQASRPSEADVAAIRATTRDNADRDALDRMGSAAAARHPADFFIPQVVAAEHLRMQTSLGLPWLNRALTLRPRSPESHYLVGLALQRAGKNRQSLFEYVAASRANHHLVRTVGDTILRNPPLRRAAVGDATWAQHDDWALLEYLAEGLSGAGTAEDMFKVDERILQVATTAGEALPAINREKARAFQDGAFLMRLNAAIAVSEREVSERFLVQVAEIRARAGMTAEAVKLLGRAALKSPPTGHGANPAAAALVKLILAQNEPREALKWVDDLQRHERLTAGEAEYLRGTIQEHLGNVEGALYSFVRAAQYRPDDSECLVAAALTAERASRSDIARQYARRALEVGRHDPAIRERLSSIVGP